MTHLSDWPTNAICAAHALTRIPALVWVSLVSGPYLWPSIVADVLSRVQFTTLMTGGVKPSAYSHAASQKRWPRKEEDSHLHPPPDSRRHLFPLERLLPPSSQKRPPLSRAQAAAGQLTRGCPPGPHARHLRRLPVPHPPCHLSAASPAAMPTQIWLRSTNTQYTAITLCLYCPDKISTLCHQLTGCHALTASNYKHGI